MHNMISHSRWRLPLLVLTLVTGLYLLYFLTFSGFVRSDDERYIIDTTHSFAIYQDTLLYQTVFLRGVQTTDVEPAQPILAIPLYLAAYHIPWIGNVHAIFLFNPIVTALTSGLLFCYLLMLGYRERTALAGAVLFGITTIAWPYTKTFFREPLTALTLLAAAYCIERLRRSLLAGGRSIWLWSVLSILLVVVAVFSKEATLIALPMLAALAYPGQNVMRQRRNELVLLLAAGAIIALIVGLLLGFQDTILNTDTFRYEIGARLQGFWGGLAGALPGLAGYLLSPGKGIWLFSPVLLLALASPWLLPAERWRESWLMLGLTLLFALVYSSVRGVVWHGGVGWGARYMVPVIPFLMIAATPALDRLLNSPHLWQRIGLGCLALAGFLIQIGGVYVLTSSYYRILKAGTGDVPWGPNAIWNPLWSQAVGSLRFITIAEPDIIWLLGDAPDWLMLVLLAGTVIGCGVLATRLQNLEGQHLPRVTAGLALLAPAVALWLTLLGLSRVFLDSRYRGHMEEVHVLLSQLAKDTSPDDIVFLSSTAYTQFFMNYYKGDSVWYGLPVSPGEQYSCEKLPRVTSGIVEEMIHPITANTFYSIIRTPPRVPATLWLVSDRGPYLPCATLPVERYFAKYGYLNELVEHTPTARALQYLLIPSPDGGQSSRFIIDEGEPSAIFGGSIALRGYQIRAARPFAERIRRAWEGGDHMGISLLWEGTETIGTDYTVGLFLISPDGQIVIQRDRAPVAGFAPTSSWETGTLLWDNYGLILPEMLPPAEYQVWIVLYSWPSLERLPISIQGSPAATDYLVLSTIKVVEQTSGLPE